MGESIPKVVTRGIVDGRCKFGVSWTDRLSCSTLGIVDVVVCGEKEPRSDDLVWLGYLCVENGIGDPRGTLKCGERLLEVETELWGAGPWNEGLNCKGVSEGSWRNKVWWW
jgi:hypothetical protein